MSVVELTSVVSTTRRSWLAIVVCTSSSSSTFAFRWRSIDHALGVPPGAYILFLARESEKAIP